MVGVVRLEVIPDAALAAVTVTSIAYVQFGPGSQVQDSVAEEPSYPERTHPAKTGMALGWIGAAIASGTVGWGTRIRT